MSPFRLFIPVLFLPAPLFAQQPQAITTTSAPIAVLHRHNVTPENGYHHILTVVPYVGTGKPGDPKRPMYAPAVRANVNSRSDILAFVQLPSDDGKFALVEFVAADRNAFQQIMADKSLTVFEKGKHAKAEVEAAMQKHRKGFVLDNFGAVVR